MDSAPPLALAPTHALSDGPLAQMALVFVIEQRRYALPLSDVLEVTPAADLISPSGAGTSFVGYLDLRGEVIPVFGAREILALPVHERRLSDRFVIIQTAARRLAIVVDRVEGVDEIQDSGARAGHGGDRDDGMTLSRRAGAAEGEALVAMIDVARLLANAADPTDLASS